MGDVRGSAESLFSFFLCLDNISAKVFLAVGLGGLTSSVMKSNNCLWQN